MPCRDSTHLRVSHLLALCAVLLVAGCSTAVGGTTVKRSGLPVKFDFASECAGFSGTSGGATSACRDGEFTVKVSRPGPGVPPQQNYLFRFDDSTPGLAVSVDARVDEGGSNDPALGVSCTASGYGQRAKEYIFALAGDEAAILRHDETDRTHRESGWIDQLAYTRVPGLTISSATRIDGECAVLSGGTTLLVMSVNGHEVLRQYTRTSYPRFVATSLWMLSGGPASFAFDNLSARVETETG